MRYPFKRSNYESTGVSRLVAFTETSLLGECSHELGGQLGGRQGRQDAAHSADRSTQGIADDDVPGAISTVHEARDLKRAAVPLTPPVRRSAQRVMMLIITAAITKNADMMRSPLLVEPVVSLSTPIT
jgi:hypothetical protein